MKKSQGMPIEIIVTAIIVVIVVAILVIAFSGGFSTTFKKLNIFANEQTMEDTEYMESQCRQACIALRNSKLSSLTEAANSEYCSLRWDTTGLGGIRGDSCLDDGTPNTVDPKDDIIFITCSLDISPDNNFNCMR